MVRHGQSLLLMVSEGGATTVLACTRLVSEYSLSVLMMTAEQCVAIPLVKGATN